jgi:hypothetical protein
MAKVDEFKQRKSSPGEELPSPTWPLTHNWPITCPTLVKDHTILTTKGALS